MHLLFFILFYFLISFFLEKVSPLIVPSNEEQTTDTRTTKHPFFEVLCLLYFTHRPIQLFNFLLKMTETFNDKPLNFFYKKAVQCLPVESTETNPESVKALSKILCTIGKKNILVQFL